jgi:hypothetical protein
MYSRRNDSFGMKHHVLWCESEQCKIMTLLGFATGLSLNQAESQPVQSNQDENNYGRQQMTNGQYIKMSVNGASTICGLVSAIIHQ